LAVLQLISGGEVGTQYPLSEPRVVLGRHPSCQIVLPNGAVSRQHARILESHGTYYIEDLRSRNKTYVNGELAESRQKLEDGDEIRLCDMVLMFLYNPSVVIPIMDDSAVARTLDSDVMEALAKNSPVDESQIYNFIPNEVEEGFDSSATMHKRSASSPSTVDPNVKLRAILEITRALSRELAVDRVLPKMLETLFNIFPNTEQGFVLLRDSEANKLRVKASRARGKTEADTVAVSMTVVRHAMETREAILSEDISDDERFKKNNALTKMQIRSMMCAPMLSQDGDGVGVIQIVTRDETQAFTEEDLDLLVTLASQASMAVENARLHEEDVHRRELERDLDFATQVQLGFLPKSRPDLDGYSFADYYEAAQSVGGDYFDYLTLPDGRVMMAIGDVAGKGMPAALLMARLYSSTRYQILTQPTPEKAVAGLNEEIAGSGLGHRFITFLLITIDPKENSLQIVNAGHLNPLIKRVDGTVEAVGQETSGLPLGIVPDMEYSSSKCFLAPGETLIACTDGITEEMNADREIYGSDRLSKTLERLNGDINDMISEIIEDVEAFSDGQIARDDTCIIGVCRSTL